MSGKRNDRRLHFRGTSASVSQHTVAEKNCFDRLEYNAEIQTGRHILDVKEIILQFFFGVFD
jgi:hypothetical protein